MRIPKKVFVAVYVWGMLLTGWQMAGAQRPTNSVPYEVDIQGTPGPGYIFLSPRAAGINDSVPTNLMLMDSAGSLIWYAPIAKTETGPFVLNPIYDFKVLENGLITYWLPGNNDRTWFLLDSHFNQIDTLECTGFDGSNEHDIYVDDRGHYFLLCDTVVTVDASHLQTRDGIPGSANCSMVYQIVQELDPQRNVVSNWYTLDHIPFEDTYTVHWGNPSFLDYIHVNSLEVDGDGILISSRHTNDITRFNRTTGQVEWRMGGKGNMFTFIGDTTGFGSQHDANIAPNGNLYLFDNGYFGGRNVGRYMEMELDTANMTATVIRTHEHPAGLVSLVMGNAILLENGNVIVNWGGEDPEEFVREVTEFAPNGDIVMEINLGSNHFSYRVHKQALPWSLPRPILSCDQATQTLTAPAGYDSYEWSTGDTSQSITVTAPGTYQVWVNQGIGFISSEPFEITDPNAFCFSVGQNEPEIRSLALFPNPTQDRFTLEIPAVLTGGWELTVADAFGRTVHSESGKGAAEVEVNGEDWVPGMYMVRLEGKEKAFLGKLMRW